MSATEPRRPLRRYFVPAGVAAGALVYGGIMWFWQREVILQAVVSLRTAFSRRKSAEGVVGA